MRRETLLYAASVTLYRIVLTTSYLFSIAVNLQIFHPTTGQAVLPGGEVSRKEQVVGSDVEGHAQPWLYGLHTHTAGQAAAQ